MGPVTTAAVVTAIISAAGTVLAAWVQARAQRPAKHADRLAAAPAEPTSTAGTSTVTGRELRPDDRR